MCQPGNPYKTDEQLASALRNHYRAYEIAKSELSLRGYFVTCSPCGVISITRTKTEKL